MNRYCALRRCILTRHSSTTQMPRFLCLSPRSPQAISLANGVYHLTSPNPTMNLKNDRRTNGFSFSNIGGEACVVRLSCESTIYINQSDFVLSPDMEACETTPEPYIATIKLAPPLNQFFRNVLFADSIFRVSQSVHSENQFLRACIWN